jgi:hypothetical protein
METKVSVKTISEIKSDGTFSIKSVSDMNLDGTTTPNIFKSQVLTESKIIDNEKGKEGELLLSYVTDKVGSIDENGNLIIEVDETTDDVNRYVKTKENLEYNG